ncbi:hypothetical protein [Leptolyngbya sp. AN03gr2]
MNSHQSKAAENNWEIKQAETISSRKVNVRKTVTGTASKTEASDEQIRKANELMMQAWDMISKRKNPDSNAQSDL